MAPAVSVLLCTVRGDHGYAHPHEDWHTLGKVIDDLAKQTFRDFELIIVDGLYEHRKDDLAWQSRIPSWMTVKHVPPRQSVWVKNKRVAISAYRNGGLIHAVGDLVVNLDDCCELPPKYLEVFVALARRGFCGSPVWRESGDTRALGPVTVPPPGSGSSVFGFSTYPLAKAIELNGYDEAYDGGQALEDSDWSARMMYAGVRYVMVQVPGFLIHDQCGHDPRAVDAQRPIVKCCNAAWQTERCIRHVLRANTQQCWPDAEKLKLLLGPCWLLSGDTCRHHGLRCAYFNEFARCLHPDAAVLFSEPPIFDLREERRKVGLV